MTSQNAGLSRSIAENKTLNLDSLLMSMPRRVLRQIASYLASSGYLEIFRLNKRLSLQLENILFQCGTYQIHSGPANYVNHAPALTAEQLRRVKYFSFDVFHVAPQRLLQRPGDEVPDPQHTTGGLLYTGEFSNYNHSQNAPYNDLYDAAKALQFILGPFYITNDGAVFYPYNYGLTETVAIHEHRDRYQNPQKLFHFIPPRLQPHPNRRVLLARGPAQIDRSTPRTGQQIAATASSTAAPAPQRTSATPPMARLQLSPPVLHSHNTRASIKARATAAKQPNRLQPLPAPTSSRRDRERASDSRRRKRDESESDNDLGVIKDGRNNGKKAAGKERNSKK
ncbi:uncharacterized protein KY384_003613 [Bacidia gigantensis]|uniref:uncharacterized protein n=1 Tax=Bacidia gigantensis TaxID=2732470 RepID=UPI001D053E0D|nr:uncharacterized protein KY384_003613 [Bacidia gigantensis]KAG8531977.1 hypothetical protein KY384_003613 [Bacidia gigantensis]